jgi:hypothetical protein
MAYCDYFIYKYPIILIDKTCRKVLQVRAVVAVQGKLAHAYGVRFPTQGKRREGKVRMIKCCAICGLTCELVTRKEEKFANFGQTGS